VLQLCTVFVSLLKLLQLCRVFASLLKLLQLCTVFASLLKLLITKIYFKKLNFMKNASEIPYWKKMYDYTWFHKKTTIAKSYLFDTSKIVFQINQSIFLSKVNKWPNVETSVNHYISRHILLVLLYFLDSPLRAIIDWRLEWYVTQISTQNCNILSFFYECLALFYVPQGYCEKQFGNYWCRAIELSPHTKVAALLCASPDSAIKSTHRLSEWQLVSSRW
jgi:hypothetical protein